MPDFFRSFLPLQNPLGFGAGDYLELLLGALLLAGLIWWKRIEPRAQWLAQRTAWSMVVLASLPVVLRLALLAHHPVPTPDVYDEFSHLLVADTLRHFRLANPMHPLHAFFETFFVLQQPTYSSIYPLGQGLILALGWTILGTPWAGVLLATGAFCALCYWMLRGWTSPGWALAGGVLTVIEFGPLSLWMNSYWGGALAAVAGCLVFGALPRLQEGSRRRDAVLLGLGLAIHSLTRPYETVFLALSVVLFFAPRLRVPGEVRRIAQIAATAAMVVAPALLLTLVQNRQVTGHWTMFPYSLSQYEYGVPAALTFQKNPEPHADLTPQQEMDYRMQVSFRPSGGESLRTYLERLEYRVRYYRFFFLPPLYLALAAFLPMLRRYRYAWVAITLALFALGTNFFPAFQVHYVAACTCLFVLMCVAGLEWLGGLVFGGRPAGAEAARLLYLICVAHFVFWYGVHVFDSGEIAQSALAYETWNNINHANPDRRIAIRDELDRAPGQLLVFVHYAPQHIFQEEWVWNAADIDGARIVWARDLGSEENAKLIAFYPTRMPLLFEPDVRPMRLTRYR
jgi:hypothetical protein